ncbi:MAG: ribosome small subunit-dependent GTPase A [Bacilli bacterium]|nr:ribosome small subunit-dependent GTPase A [Bacilli bacterium]
MEGQIIKIVSDLYYVKESQEIYACKCRGRFRKENTIPLVGDYCVFDKGKKVIDKILPRKNELKRPPVSNIDQAIIVMSIVEPNFSFNLLDKFITSIKLKKIEPIICITKLDIASEKDKEKIINTLQYYKEIGYKVIDNQNIEIILETLKNKTTVFTGQTGAGKSTILNKLNKDFNLETGEISKALGRGKHTTRVVSLLEINDGKVLDTPGFSALDFNEYSIDAIKETFSEFDKYPCLYKDCSHTKEKECLVKKAVNDNNILKSRYENYLRFIERR